MIRDACPISGASSPEIETLVSLPFDEGVLGDWAKEKGKISLVAGKAFRIYRNPSLDFYWQQLVMSNEEAVDHRDRIRKKNNEVPPLALTEASHKVEEAILLRLLVDSKRPKVLDYGMGLGTWLLAMRAFGAECWGTDIDPLSKIIAKDNGLRFEGELDNLPEGYFDFINSDQVFEHLPDPLQHLQQIVRKLAPGGIIKLSVPGDSRMPRKLERLAGGAPPEVREFLSKSDALSPLCHINLFTPDSLRALGEAAGLESFRIPLKTAYATMTGFFSARQWNRNLYNPLKSHLGKRTWQYFRKPAAKA